MVRTEVEVAAVEVQVVGWADCSRDLARVPVVAQQTSSHHSSSNNNNLKDSGDKEEKETSRL